jgi:radical SAM superfamily enzyme YgiQ (UPF0313 family)
MKITFIQPFYENVWESLGLGSIIAYVKEYSGEEDLEISYYQGKFDSDSVIVDGAYDSDIVAFSCTSPAFDHGLSLARQIKTRNPNVHTVFGGWHPTALPDDVIKRSCVDQVIVGEGEVAMVRVVLGSRNPIILGRNIDPLSELPNPDRAEIRQGRCVDLCEEMTGVRSASFQYSRGCRANCAFCAEKIMTGYPDLKKNPMRTRDVENLLTEIEGVSLSYNLNYFKFVDATFDRDIDTVLAFCQAKINRRNTTPWEANIHPGFVQDEQVFNALAEANCVQINVGVESGSPYILKDIGKGTNLTAIKNVFKWAKQYGIKRRAFVILGMPQETPEDMRLTEELLDEIEPEVVGFTILAPYPGTDFYDEEKHKYVEWSKVDEYSNDIWCTPHISNERLKEEQARLVNKYKDDICWRQQ